MKQLVKSAISDIKHGYKIVGNFNNKKISYVVGDRGVEYVVGEWVRRPMRCGPLAVFEDAKTAKVFSESIIGLGKLECYECEYTPSDDSGFWVEGKRRSEEVAPPPGTICAEEVRILDKVNLYELVKEDET